MMGDFVLKNAKAVCNLPPKVPVPVYVDDNRGSRHHYCSSGLARNYVFKPEFGKIPKYLKKRNIELGRPAVPDFRKFYRPHVCKYIFGYRHCPQCGHCIKKCGQDKVSDEGSRDEDEGSRDEDEGSRDEDEENKHPHHMKRDT